jgi:hypothetical protein
MALVRFQGAPGNLIVTVRESEVERVFCSQGGAAIETEQLSGPERA